MTVTAVMHNAKSSFKLTMDISGLIQNLVGLSRMNKSPIYEWVPTQGISLFSLSFSFNIYILAGISCPQVLSLCGGIVPSDFFIRTVRLRHVPYCVRHQYMKTACVGRQYMKI